MGREHGHILQHGPAGPLKKESRSLEETSSYHYREAKSLPHLTMCSSDLRLRQLLRTLSREADGEGRQGPRTTLGNTKHQITHHQVHGTLLYLSPRYWGLQKS